MTTPKNDDRAMVAARLSGVVEAFQRLANADQTILEAGDRGVDFLTADGAREAGRLMKLTDPELRDLGWTRRELKVAISATLPKAELPWLLLAAQERHIARAKTLPTEGGGEKARGFVIAATPLPPEDEEDDAAP